MVLFALYQAALIYGAVVGLLALGFRLTHATTGYMNLGHTVNLGVGMMLGFIVIHQLKIAPIHGVPFTFILTGTFNAVVYLLFYQWMEKRNYSEALIALFGLVFVFLWSNILAVSTFWVSMWFPSEYWCGPPSYTRFWINHIHYRSENLGILRGGFTEGMMLFILITIATYWVYRTRFGLQFRAIKENRDLTEICGASSGKLKTYAWFIAGGLAGVAGILIPYMMKGEFGRDIEGFFIPVVLAAVIAEKWEPWRASLVGLLVGFAHIVIINNGQMVLGVWFGEYWNIVDSAALVVVMFSKDRRFSLPNWLSPHKP